MASIIAAPTSLDITAVAGDPLTLLFNISLADSNGNPLPWSDFTSPTVYVGKATAEQTSLEPVVTMPATGQVQLAWSGTQTASIGNSSGLLWSLSATISGTGPLALTAGNLTANPATTPGNSSGSSGNLSVNVGLATVSLSVTVGGGGGSSSGVSELTDGTGTTTGIVTIQGAGGVTVSVSKTGTNGTITVTGDLAPSFTGAGQLLVGTGNGTFEALPAPTAGQVLSYSASAPGVEWGLAGGGFGLLALGTVTTSSVLSAQAGVYTVATATTTANDTCAFTLPHAVGGYGFRLYITNPASGVQVPTFNAASGETFAWLSPLEWDSTPGALNIIDFESTVNGAWDGAPVTSGLGPSAPLQEQQAAYAPGANGTVTIPGPLVTPYITQHHITLPTGTSANPISLPTPTTATIGVSFSVWVDQVGTGVATISFTGGTVRWVGGSAPTAPAAGKRLWMAFTNVDGTTLDGVIVSTGY